MKRIFCQLFGILFICQVLAAPKQSSGEADSVEQELIRHHHSTATDKLQSAADDKSVSGDNIEEDNLSVVKSFEEAETESEADEEGTITEDDLYDITVGDVIRDVLLTLRDHPEIVRELIASEKAKLAAQIEAFNSLVDGQDSVGDNLAGFMKPPEQLNTVAKSVEKKTGRSGMPVLPQRQFEEKRKEEVINDGYSQNDESTESREYEEFMLKPQEGGKDDPMFNYEKSASDSSKDTSGQTKTNVASPQESSSYIITSQDTEKSSNKERQPYIFPFLNPMKMYRKYGSKLSASENNVEGSELRHSETDETTSGEHGKTENVSWLHQRGPTEQADDHEDKRSPQDNAKMIKM